MPILILGLLGVLGLVYNGIGGYDHRDSLLAGVSVMVQLVTLPNISSKSLSSENDFSPWKIVSSANSVVTLLLVWLEACRCMTSLNI